MAHRRFVGWLAGSALLIGAAIGYFVHVSQRTIAAIMAFGSGVLISALSFDLMDAAYAHAPGPGRELCRRDRDLSVSPTR